MSKSAIPAQGTTLHIAGNSGGAKNITAIAAGNPTIITSNAHGFSNGDSVAIAGVTGTDAALLNGLTFVVTSKTANTFALQIDTTGKTVIATGTATPLAWIKVGNLKGIKPSGSSASETDVTDLDSTAKEFRTGLRDPGTISIENFCIDSDAGQAAMLAAFAAQSIKTFKITYPSGPTPVRTFDASVKKFPEIGDISTDGVVSGSIELRLSGSVTVS